MIDPNDYERMMSLGSENSKLQRQMAMAQQLRESIPQGIPQSEGRLRPGPSKWAQGLNVLSSLANIYSQHKLGTQMDANKLAQGKILAARMGQPGAQPQVGGYGLMPPRQRQPGQLGGDLNMFDME